MNEQFSDRVIRKFQRELNAGAVSLVLLKLISESDRALYGYEISRTLTAASNLELPMNEAAIYPVLRSLERQGLLSSYTQKSQSGPPRRYYELAPAGRQALTEMCRAWTATKTFVDCILDSHLPRENNDASDASSSGPKVSRKI